VSRYRDLYYQAAVRMQECDYETGECYECGKYVLGLKSGQNTRRGHAEDCAWCLILLADFYCPMPLFRVCWRWSVDDDLS
jgi:hypothetical protein